MKWQRYLIPLLLLIYGVLMINGVSIPRLGNDGGPFFIFVAVLMLILIPILSFYDKKYFENKKKHIHIDKIKKEPLDYICLSIFMTGLIYFGSLVFIPVTETLLYIFLFAMIFCTTSLKKFLQ